MFSAYQVSTRLPQSTTSLYSNLVQVLRESFPRANPTTRQCVIEYISDNQLVDPLNITSLLQTYSVTKHLNILKLCVQYIMSSITTNIHHVNWEQLSGEVVRDLLLEIHAGTKVHI